MHTAHNLHDLFVSTLQDIYNGEKQVLKALPKMTKHASSAELRAAFERHHDQTEAQIGRLQRVFELLNRSARGRTCEAIEGLIEEGGEVMSETDKGNVMDAGLIAAAQAVEHYEIARYGTLKAWAQLLGMEEAARLLNETLQEAKQTDELLTRIAAREVNRQAA